MSVQASFPVHAQVEAEAGFLSELEAHSFGLASWQMRLQDLSLPIPDPGAGIYWPVQPCVDFYMCSRGFEFSPHACKTSTLSH